MDLMTIPDEIFQKIINFLPLKDVKSFALSSKRMNYVSRRRICSAPRFQSPIKVESLMTLVDHPIKELHTQDIDIVNWEDFRCACKQMANLQLLYIDNLERMLLDDFADFTKVISRNNISMIVETAAVCVDSTSDFKKLLNILKCIRLEALVVNLDILEDGYKLTLEDFTDIIIFPLKCISMKKLEIERETFPKFIDLICTKASCSVSLDGDEDEDKFKFNVNDLEDISRNIKIVSLDITSLDYLEEDRHVNRYAEILKKMDHLSELTFDELFSSTDLDLFTDFPIKVLVYDVFVMEETSVDEIVDILSRMKQLETLVISSHCSGYKLSLDELRKLTSLSLSYHVCMDGLDFHAGNEANFRSLLDKVDDVTITEQTEAERDINKYRRMYGITKYRRMYGP